MLTPPEKARQAAEALRHVIQLNGNGEMEESRLGVFSRSGDLLGIMGHSHWTYAGIMYAQEILGFTFELVKVEVTVKKEVKVDA